MVSGAMAGRQTNRQVLIFCVEGGQASWERVFVQSGLQARALPVLQARPLSDNAHQARIRNTLAQLDHYRWLLFGSRRGVVFFQQFLEAFGQDASALAHMELGVVGQKTARNLPDRWPGAVTARVASNLQALLDAVAAVSPPGTAVLNPTSLESLEKIKPNVPASLRLTRLPIYHLTLLESSRTPVRSALKSARKAVLCFTSPSSFDALLHLVEDPAVLQRMPVATLGPSTSTFIRRKGFSVTVEAPRPEARLLAQTLAAYLNRPR